MGFYHLDLDRLSEFTGRTVEDLKKEPYATLETMAADMEREKFLEQKRKNEKDKEYERLVLKYFQPVPLLRHWFDDKEIVLSCANTGVSERGICQEVTVKPSKACWYPNAELIRTSMESVPQYDRSGRELMERAREMRDVYRVASQYQGLRHGQVVLDLLYGRYPELSKYGFDAYGMSCGEGDYEIYPKNHIYTSLSAIMSGDVDWILHRNREYCAWYNNGRMSTAECEKAFRTDEAREMFDVIRQIGEKERALGHSPVTVMESGAMITAQGLITTKVSDSRNVTLLMKREPRQGERNVFKLATAAPYVLDRLADEFVKMMPKQKVNIIIAHKTDYLREHAVNFGGLPKDLLKKISGFVVLDTFGWIKGDECEVIFRIDCPDLMNK